MYKFYINDKELTSTPSGWEKFTTKITRDVDNRRMTVTYPTNLVFWGDGFNFLFDAIESNGYDTVFEFRAEKTSADQDTHQTIEGIIFLIDVEFDLSRRTATVQVKENGFISRIWGNISNPVSLPASTTKNGFGMISTSRREIQLSTFGGVSASHAGVRNGVDVTEALKELILSVSDNNVSLDSPYLDALGTGSPLDKKLMLIRGREFRLGGDRTSVGDYEVKTSLDDLFRAVGRIYNLYLYPNTKAQPPVLVISDESEFYPITDASASIESPEKMTLSYFQELFFSNVRLGSSRTKFEDGNTAMNIPRLPFVTFLQDDYFLDGQSNIDRRNDLSLGEYIIDSNVIRDILFNDVDAYDNDLILLQYDDVDGASWDSAPALYDLFGAKIFNRGLMADEISRRHQMFGKITNNLTDISIDNRFTYNTNEDDKQLFFAPATTVYSQPYNATFSQLQRDYSDGQYNTATSVYTAEVNGEYTFGTSILIQVNALQPIYSGLLGQSTETHDTLHCDVELHINNGSTTVYRLPINQLKMKSVGLYTLTGSISAEMQVNETARVVLNFRADTDGFAYEQLNPYALRNNIEWTFASPSRFDCTGTPNLNLTFSSTLDSSNTYKGSRVVLNHYLNHKQIKKILDEPQNSVDLINFVDVDTTKKCWINSLQINNETGEIDAELITNIANTQDIPDSPSLTDRPSRPQPTDCDNWILCFENEINSQYIGAI